jgi:Negative regulator of sigma F
VRDREIDEILTQAARTPHAVDPALLDRVAGAIGSSLPPVRPLPPARALAGGLVLIGAAVALAGAARLGPAGVQKLSVLERALIFPALGILMCLAATEFVSEVIPGSRRRVAPGFLLWGGSLALLAVFAVLFRDYRTDRFVPQGVACLSAGLLYAIPAALASWLLLRRGFAVNPPAAGLVSGTLAGLAGVTMLELHCANFQALHVLLWHTAVMPVSAAAGVLVVWAIRSEQHLRRRRRQ